MNTNARAAERGEREWGVEECEVYYTMRRKVGKVARERDARGARELFRFARHVARVDPASSRFTDWSAFSPLHLLYPALSPLRRPPQGRPLL